MTEKKSGMHKIFGETRPAGQLLALVFIFIIFFIVTMGLTVAVTLFGVQADSLWLQALTQIICFAGTAVSFALLFKGTDRNFLKLKPSGKMAPRLLYAVLVLLCVLPLSDWLAQVNDNCHLPQSLAFLEEALREISQMSQALMEKYLLRGTVGALVANIVVLALIPAICEELLFRGALQQVLCRCCRNVHVAIWISAAIFSLMHGEVFAFLPRFMLGAVLGYLFYYGASLWFNALAHFLNNAILVVIYYLVALGKVDYSIAESFNSPWYVALLAAAAAAALLFFFARSGKGEECRL